MNLRREADIEREVAGRVNERHDGREGTVVFERGVVVPVRRLPGSPLIRSLNLAIRSRDAGSMFTGGK